MIASALHSGLYLGDLRKWGNGIYLEGKDLMLMYGDPHASASILMNSITLSSLIDAKLVVVECSNLISVALTVIRCLKITILTMNWNQSVN